MASSQPEPETGEEAVLRELDAALATLRAEHDDIMAQLGGLLTEGEEPLSEAVAQLQLLRLKEIETEITELEGQPPPAKTEACPICLDVVNELDKKDLIKPACCGVMMHASCFAKCAECPICRPVATTRHQRALELDAAAAGAGGEPELVCESCGIETGDDVFVHAFGCIALCSDCGEGQCVGTSEQENCAVCSAAAEAAAGAVTAAAAPTAAATAEGDAAQDQTTAIAALNLQAALHILRQDSEVVSWDDRLEMAREAALTLRSQLEAVGSRAATATAGVFEEPEPETEAEQ